MVPLLQVQRLQKTLSLSQLALLKSSKADTKLVLNRVRESVSTDGTVAKHTTPLRTPLINNQPVSLANLYKSYNIRVRFNP